MKKMKLMKNISQMDEGVKPALIVLSGYDDFSYAKAAIQSGALSYILKPVDKKELITRIIENIDKTKHFLSDKDFDLSQLIQATDFKKLEYLQEGANAVCGSMEDKKTFSTYGAELSRLMKYIDRGDIGRDTRKEYESSWQNPDGVARGVCG